ncbi:MAG TPA: hypothetical protein VFZ77_10525 [Acidimicrobiales bacterium]
MRPDPSARRRLTPLVALALAAVPATTLAACGDDDPGGGLSERRAEVAERGAQVMPFDLDATTHVFEPRDDGLVQRVVADDPGDSEQVGLVREHLADEAARFAAGDLGDPAAIHGRDMPGLADIEAGHDRIDVRYRDLPGGASITYTTADPDLVGALHAWGDAQVSDHGAHAEHGGDGA